MLKNIALILCVSIALASCSSGEKEGVNRGNDSVEKPSVEIGEIEENIDEGVAVDLDEGEDIVEGDEVLVGRAFHDFKLEAWGDNWFDMSNNGVLVVEDSVSITTEKSFNSETKEFSASYPLNLAFTLKDFKQDDSGLEYIGTKKQQMGDGGFIMQITDRVSGEVVAVSDDTMKCMVIHTAPLDKSCEKSDDSSTCGFESLDEPADWKTAGFDDSSWESATIHSEADVSPKKGYDEITWDKNAELVWGPDLETNNTILCRLTVKGK